MKTLNLIISAIVILTIFCSSCGSRADELVTLNSLENVVTMNPEEAHYKFESYGFHFSTSKKDSKTNGLNLYFYKNRFGVFTIQYSEIPKKIEYRISSYLEDVTADYIKQAEDAKYKLLKREYSGDSIIWNYETNSSLLTIINSRSRAVVATVILSKK